MAWRNYVTLFFLTAKDHPVPDFNFHEDPESVHIVFFNRNKKKIWLLPKDTCLTSRLALVCTVYNFITILKIYRY